MSLIVDASVVIKWFVVEDLLDEADQLRPLIAELSAPDFLLVEIGNIAWKKTRQGILRPHDAARILAHLRRSGMQLVPTTSLLDNALKLAQDLDHPVYDCLYIALIEMLDAMFLTCDGQLYAKLSRSRFASAAYLLSDVDRLLDRLNTPL